MKTTHGFYEKRGDLRKDARKNAVTHLFNPEPKAAFGVMSTLMTFEGGEKVNFAICKAKYATDTYADSN
ncbi:MAG: hypothetical protein CMM01_17055 [Rhodopirellula sp.]|nr:hypothetical protein [Rhodopirellula sp.]